MPEQIGLEDGADHLHARIEHAHPVADGGPGRLEMEAGVVDQHIDPPEPAPGVRDQAGDVLGSGQVEPEGLDVDVLGPQAVRGLAPGLRVAAGEDDPVAAPPPSWRQVSSPMPRLPPVTTAILRSSAMLPSPAPRCEY